MFRNIIIKTTNRFIDLAPVSTTSVLDVFTANRHPSSEKEEKCYREVEALLIKLQLVALVPTRPLSGGWKSIQITEKAIQLKRKRRSVVTLLGDKERQEIRYEYIVSIIERQPQKNIREEKLKELLNKKGRNYFNDLDALVYHGKIKKTAVRGPSIDYFVLSIRYKAIPVRKWFGTNARISFWACGRSGLLLATIKYPLRSGTERIIWKRCGWRWRGSIR